MLLVTVSYTEVDWLFYPWYHLEVLSNKRRLIIMQNYFSNFPTIGSEAEQIKERTTVCGFVVRGHLHSALNSAWIGGDPVDGLPQPSVIVVRLIEYYSQDCHTGESVTHLQVSTGTKPLCWRCQRVGAL